MATHTFNFLGLPAELRKMVYELALGDHICVGRTTPKSVRIDSVYRRMESNETSANPWHRVGEAGWTDRITTRSGTGILHVNKLVHREAQSVLISNTQLIATFRLYYKDGGRKDLQPVLRSDRDTNNRGLRIERTHRLVIEVKIFDDKSQHKEQRLYNVWKDTLKSVYNPQMRIERVAVMRAEGSVDDFLNPRTRKSLLEYLGRRQCPNEIFIDYPRAPTVYLEALWANERDRLTRIRSERITEVE